MSFIILLLIIIFFVSSGICYALAKPLWQTNLHLNARYHLPLGILPFVIFASANFIHSYQTFADGFLTFTGIWGAIAGTLFFSLCLFILAIFSFVCLLPYYKKIDLSKLAKIGFIVGLTLQYLYFSFLHGIASL